MAIRKIDYTVTAAGISPATVQPGGVQGEHRATEVVFALDSALASKLESIVESGGQLVYRVDGYNGEGGVARSDPKAFTQTVSYLLEEWLTRYGGTIKVVLVISLIKDGETEMELYSFPAVLRLKNLPNGKRVDGVNYESMSTLAQVAKDSADTAVVAADEAVEAQIKTEEARRSLEEGTEWIFDGGNSAGSVSVELVIDDEVSDVSNNAVANKVIKGYIDGKIAETTEYFDSKFTETTEYIDGRTVDFITEQGASGVWTYRKWNSGIAECWYKGNVTFPTDGGGAGIEGFYVNSVNIALPFDFISAPFSVCDTSWNAINWVQCSANTTSVTVRKFANTNGTNATVNDVSIYVKGWWK